MRGWRQTIWAASAPVKPEAPATKTLAFSLTWGSSYLLERGDDRVALRRDLLVGEGAVGGAELEPQGEALAPLPDLLALVEVEDLGLAQQPAAAGQHGLANLRGRDVARDHDGEGRRGGLRGRDDLPLGAPG